MGRVKRFAVALSLDADPVRNSTRKEGITEDRHARAPQCKYPGNRSWEMQKDKRRMYVKNERNCRGLLTAILPFSNTYHNQ